MQNETETITITQTAPDGTETKIEITQTAPEGEDLSLVDEVIEALFDDTSDEDADVSDDLENNETPVYLVTEETSNEPSFFETENETVPSSEFSSETEPVQSEVFMPVDYNTSTEQTPFTTESPEVSIISEPSGYSENEVSGAEAEAQMHADAAREAQEAANEFVAKGDYEAAAEARQTAENESWEAGDQSMLEGSNVTQLENAAYEQDQADYYRAQQEEYTAEGNYEAAQEAAGKVVENTTDADYYGGGDDHSTQARNDEHQLGNAVWEENNAEWYANNAEQFAAEGNYEAAADYAETAGEHYDAADVHAESTFDGSTYDASSEVESGGTYDAADYSSYDAGGGVDYSSSYDAGTTDYSGE